MRRIFVGDIQGCRAELDNLLEEVSFVEGADVLYPVGDLVRKGPDSPGVLSRLMDIDAQPVLGNHDLRYLARNEAVDSAHARWLSAQPIVRVMDDVIMVHAGLHPLWSSADYQNIAAEEDVQFAVSVRYCDSQGNRPDADWPAPELPFRPWYDFYEGSCRVVFGHWARQGLVRKDKVIGLDTGCCYGKQLTAWIAEEDRIVQVAAG